MAEVQNPTGDNISKLYQLFRENNFDVPEDESVFRNAMADENNLKAAYKTLRDNEFDVPENETEFISAFSDGLKKKEPTSEDLSQPVEPLSEVSPEVEFQNSGFEQALGEKPLAPYSPDAPINDIREVSTAPTPYQDFIKQQFENRTKTPDELQREWELANPELAKVALAKPRNESEAQHLPGFPGSNPASSQVLDEKLIEGNSRFVEDKNFVGALPEGATYMGQDGTPVRVNPDGSMEDARVSHNPLVNFYRGMSNLAFDQIPATTAGTFAAGSSALADAADAVGIDDNPLRKLASESNAYAIKQNKESEETPTFNKASDVDGFWDAANYVASTLGQTLPQAGLNIASFGASGFIQEIGGAYNEQVEAIAKKNGITPEQVIERNLDTPALAIATGTINGMLEKLAPGQAKTIFQAGMKPPVIRTVLGNVLKGAATEGGTEMVQEIDNIIAQNIATDKDVRNVDWDRVKEAGIAGTIGGAGMTSVASLGSAAKDAIGNTETATQGEAIAQQEPVAPKPDPIRDALVEQLTRAEQVAAHSSNPVYKNLAAKKKAALDAYDASKAEEAEFGLEEEPEVENTSGVAFNPGETVDLNSENPTVINNETVSEIQNPVAETIVGEPDNGGIVANTEGQGNDGIAEQSVDETLSNQSGNQGTDNEVSAADEVEEASKAKQEELENNVKTIEKQISDLREVDGSIHPDNRSEFNDLKSELTKAQKKAIRGNSTKGSIVGIKKFDKGVDRATSDPKILEGKELVDAEDLIEQAIQASKTPEQALDKIKKLGYILDMANLQALNTYLNDRMSDAPKVGNNKDSFKAWRTGTTDAELEAASSPEPVSQTEEKVETVNEVKPTPVKVNDNDYAVSKEGENYVITNAKTGKAITPTSVVGKKVVSEYESAQVQKQEEDKQLTIQNGFASRVTAINQGLSKKNKDGSVSKKAKAESEKAIGKLIVDAGNAGFEVVQKKDGTYQLQKDGKRVQYKGAITNTSEVDNFIPLESRNSEVQNVVQKLIDRAKEDPKSLLGLGLGIKNSEVNGVLNDIETGRNTERANRLLQLGESAVKNGGVEFTEGSGINIRKAFIPLNDLMAFETSGNETGIGSVVTDDELQDLIANNSNVRDIIQDFATEDNSLDLDKLADQLNNDKGAFTGAHSFPYNLSEAEYETLKTIVNERTSQKTGENNGTENESVEGVRATDPGSQTENTPTGETEQEVVTPQPETKTEATKKESAKAEKVTFEFADGTVRRGTIISENEDGSVTIKGENGRTYPSVKRSDIGGKVAYQTQRTFAALTAPSTTQVQPAGITGGKPKKLRDIMKSLADLAEGKLFYSKKPNPHRAALGTYNPRTAALAIRSTNDFNTAAHEVGHSLDDQYGIVSSISGLTNQADIENELLSLSVHGSTAPAGHSNPQLYEQGEGLAEFVRSYLVNPDEAKRQSPNLAAHFENTVPKETRKAIDAVSDDIRTLIGSGASGMTAANIQMEQDKKGNPIADFFSPKGGLRLTAVDKVEAQMFDDLVTIRKAQEIGKELNGLDKVGFSKLPYVLARLHAGFNDRIGRIFKSGLVDTNNQVVKDSVTGQPMTMKWLWEGLDNTSEETLKAEQQDVVNYAVSKRALELLDRINGDKIQSVLDKGNHVPDAILTSNPAFAKYQTQNATNKAVSGSRLVNVNISDSNFLTGAGAGIFADSKIAEQTIADIEALQTSDPEKFARIEEGVRRYQAYADQNLKRMVEAGLLSQEQYDKIKENNSQYVAMQRVLEAAPGEEIIVHSGNGSSLASNPKLINTAKGSSRTIKNPYASLLDFTAKSVKAADKNAFKLALREFFKGSRDIYQGDQVALSNVMHQAAEGDKNTIQIMVNGEKEFWKVDEDLYRTITNMDKVSTDGAFLKALMAPANLLRFTVTNAPTFAIRNKIRDIGSWLIISKHNPKDGFKFLFNKAENEKMKAAYSLYGGGQSGHHLVSEDFFYSAMEDEMRSLAKNKKNIILDPKLAAGKLWKGYQNLLSSAETSTRISEFKAAFVKAKAQGMNDHDAYTYAAFEARDLMDFSKGGEAIRQANKFIAFLNPAFQALDKTKRSIQNDPVGFTVRWAVYAALPAVLNRVMIEAADEESKEEYQKMPAYRRDFFYNIPLGDNYWIVLPKPFELGAMASGVERTLDKLYYGNEKALEGFGGSVASAFVPVDESALSGSFKGLVEVSTNYDYFKEEQIIPSWESDKRVELRDNSRASAIGKYLQELSGDNVDARNIDHIIRSSTSYMGGWAMKASNEIAGDSEKGFNLSDTGLIKSDPVADSRDVIFVMEKAEQNGLDRRRDVKVLGQLLKTYYGAEDKDKQKAGEAVREYAKQLRNVFEKTDIEQIAQEKAEKKRLATK